MWSSIPFLSSKDKKRIGIKTDYKGDINQITKAISSIKVRDVNVEEPTLEEVFMHYYMIFLSVGMFVSSVNKRHKKSGNISVCIIMITFLISSLINMVDSVEFLKYITPFKYFETSYILNEMSLEAVYIILSVLIIVAGIGGTLIFYPKRDLSI